MSVIPLLLLLWPSGVTTFTSIMEFVYAHGDVNLYRPL